MDQLVRDINSQLAKARTLLALAHRHATKLPLEPTDQQKSKSAFAEANGLCVTATRTAKSHNLFRLQDSGLNPSEIRQAVQRALTKSKSASAARDSGKKARGELTPEPRAVTLFAQLDACRRINVEGVRWLTQARASQIEEWRGNQLFKVAEQLGVITALESKLLGIYVLGDSRLEPAVVRKAVGNWAANSTRKEAETE